MVQTTYDSSVLTPIPDSRIAILQAAWHREHTDRMVSACADLLRQAGAALIEIHHVPGSYELPLAAKLLAKKAAFDGIVVFGAVVQGETEHFRVIVDTCINELGKVMYDYEIPVCMELMPVLNIEQLIARSTGENNKGIEAALAISNMIAWCRTITESSN